MSRPSVKVGGEETVIKAAPVTPTQQVVNDANRVEYVIDKRGRRLGFKRITASLRRRVLKALSAESGEKGQLLVMATLACACVSVDNEPVVFPLSEVAVDFLIDRLEQEGLEAIGIGLAEKFPVAVDGDDVKNS